MIESVVMLIAVVLVAACVGIHYEGMRVLGRWMGRARARRRGVIGVVLGLLATHVVEICLFAGVYAALSSWPESGAIRFSGGVEGSTVLGFTDFLYFSSTVYTTLGFGDLLPVGAQRLLAGVEALLGFGLLTWSASFTFLEMQRFWPAGE